MQPAFASRKPLLNCSELRVEAAVSRLSDYRRVIVVGAGPGGLAIAMLLAHQGLQVTIVERAGPEMLRRLRAYMMG